MKITKEAFGILCFNVLMANGDGFMGKHPTYMLEKINAINMMWDAYGLLDRGNQKKVLEYLKYWKFEIPEKISEYEKLLY